MKADYQQVGIEKLCRHRGSQYCCKQYVDLLSANNIAISMTQNGDPYENAIAERLNGIIKSEFNLYNSPFGFEQTCTLVDKSIAAYNAITPHSSCDYLTFCEAHHKSGPLKKRWKKYQKPKFEKLLYRFFRITNPTV